MSSLLRAHAWRQHPMFKYGPQHLLIGLPTGVVMFLTVKAAEKAGVLTYDKDANPKKYEFVSAVYGAPPKESAGHGHH